MTNMIEVQINGQLVAVQSGISVAAAIMNSGNMAFRRSVSEMTRAPLCGMGICFECRVTINGQSQLRSCLLACEPKMDIRTDDDDTTNLD
jgi:sarcosine oxidase subunit alpha